MGWAWREAISAEKIIAPGPAEGRGALFCFVITFVMISVLIGGHNFHAAPWRVRASFLHAAGNALGFVGNRAA